MNKIITFSLLLIFTSVHVSGQSTKNISLKDAIATAIQNAENLKNLQLDEEIQLEKNREVIAQAMPQVSGTGQTTYYTNTPQILFPNSNFPIYDVLNKEGVKDRAGNVIDTKNAVTSSQKVSFIAPFNVNFGASINQLLFQPDLFIAYKARQTVLDFAKANTLVATEKVKEDVQKAYYAVLIAQEQKSVLNETKTRLDKLLSDMTQMYKNGFAEKLDIDKITVTKNNTEAVINAINISTALLKNTMGIPQSDDIVLTEKLNIDELKADLLQAETKFDYGNRKEIAMLDISRKLQELDLKRNELGYLPTVAGFFNFQRSGQRNATFNPNNPWLWFNTGLVGINVNMPIYDGGQRKHKIAQSTLVLQKVDNSINQVKRAIDLEQSIALNSLNNAVLNLDVQQRNMELAKYVYETTKKKYESGLGSSFEVTQTDTELQRAQGSYFQALYDAYVARVGYRKSLGKL
jgi:outer membrane protein